MTALRSQDEIRNTVVSLGLPEHPYFMRRTARAMDLLDTGKVNFVGRRPSVVDPEGDDIFRVHSQFDNKIYHVELNHGNPGCTCPDHQKNPGVLCKHMISATIYKKERQAKQATQINAESARSLPLIIRRRDDGLWCIIDGNHLVQITTINGKLFCNCKECRKSRQQNDCRYKKAIRNNGGGGGGNGSKITNECGSERAKQLQEKMNAQLNKSGNNGNGAHAPSQIQLDPSDPFQESEQNDIDQIEGRKNGELAWKLSNGEYCISYRGIMTLAEKHGIEYEVSLHDDTNTVIAKAMNDNERVSGKPMNGCADTAIELAKRNAARQLLPLVEIKAVEKKAQLEAEFSWQKAYAKCVELVGGKAQVDIIIHDLVKDGKLRQDHPAHYDRTEWLIIHDACKQDASNDNNDGGDNTPSSTPSTVDIPPANETRKPVGESGCGNPDTRDVVSCTTAFIGVGELTDGEVVDEIHCAICSRQLTNPTSRRLQIGPECRKKLGITGLSYLQDDNVVSAELMEASKLYHEEQFRKWIIRACFTLDAPIPTKVLNWLGNEWFGYRKAPILYYLSADGQLNRIDTFKRKLRHKIITKETAETELDSHAVRIASETNGNGNGNGGRKLQMDRKLRTWLIEAEGTKKEISCREIAEQYDSSQKGIIKRLRAGIDSGADFSTVELN